MKLVLPGIKTSEIEMGESLDHGKERITKCVINSINQLIETN